MFRNQWKQTVWVLCRSRDEREKAERLHKFRSTSVQWDEFRWWHPYGCSVIESTVIWWHTTPFGTTEEDSMIGRVRFSVRLPLCDFAFWDIGHLFQTLLSTVVPANSPTKTRLPCWEVLWRQMLEDQPCLKDTSRSRCVKTWRSCRDSESRLVITLAAPASHKLHTGFQFATIAPSQAMGRCCKD